MMSGSRAGRKPMYMSLAPWLRAKADTLRHAEGRRPGFRPI